MKRAYPAASLGAKWTVRVSRVSWNTWPYEPYAGYAAALIATALVFALRLLLSPIFGPGAPLLSFVVSVFIAAWCGGLGPGLFATALGMLLARLYFVEPRFTLSLVHLDTPEIARFALFALIGLMISWVNASRRHAMREVSRSLKRQRHFLREVLLVATEGRLRLCESACDLPLPLAVDPVAGAHTHLGITRETLREVRRLAHAASCAAGLPENKALDFLSGVGEAAMNAVVHAGGGETDIRYSTTHGLVQVCIRDRGGGIAEGMLHRATLERGYSSAGSLGQGFWLMIHTCDRIWLQTGEGGTTIVLEQDRAQREEEATPWTSETIGIIAARNA